MTLRAGRALLPALLLAFLLGCASGPRPSGVAAPSGSPVPVSVRVSWKDAPLPGVRVEWRDGIEPGSSAAIDAAVTDASGVASSSLPPGRYFLVADWRPDGDHARPLRPGDRHAFFGGNPVFLAPGPPREFFVGLAEFAPPPAPPSGGRLPASGISGVVLADGVPLADAYVYAYLRTGSAFRDMGFAASAPTGDDGAFLLDVPPGRYWLIARKRVSGGIAGPLRKGDAFGYYPGNPVEVEEGGGLLVSIPATTLRLRNVPGYAADAKATAFVEGRVLGPDGKPRSGVYAALYDNPDLLNRPLFISDVTGDDGRYRLPVPVPGTYYLGARSGYGGSPTPGDLYGRYEGNAGHSITVRENDRLTGIDLVVSEVR